MQVLSRTLLAVHGGFTRSGGNFRKNNWAKGRLDVGRILTREPLAATKFKKPKFLTKHGFPSIPRTSTSDRSYDPKNCNMTLYAEILHEQNVRHYGLIGSDRSAFEAAKIAMQQPMPRK